MACEAPASAFWLSTSSLPMIARARAFIDDEPVLAALLFSVGVSLARYGHLAIIQTDLGADEAQYWFWSQELSWGYYSKPPMIAWLIGLSTSLLGDTEIGVRALSPLLLAGTGFALFAAGRQLFGDKAGLSALLFWHFMPAVVLGGTLMSTDIPLLFFWSISLWVLIKLIEAPRSEKNPWALALGAALAAAFLSKYAAIYFPIGLALAAMSSSYVRRGLTIGSLLLATSLFAVLIAPHLRWNMANGFQTVKHTADNASWSGVTLQFDELGDFLVAQLAVLGPILFIVLVIGAVRYRFRADPKEAFLLSMVLPPFLIICGQALLSRAHANWAIAAYPAALVLLPLWILRMKIERWALPSTIILHGMAWVCFISITTDFSRADALGLSSALHRERAWGETADLIRPHLIGKDGLILDDREIAAHLIWEFRHDDIDIEVYDNNHRPANTFEITLPFSPQEGRSRLLVTKVRGRAITTYTSMYPWEELGSIYIDLGTERHGLPERTLDLYAVNR
ncbi:MAG: glycosyltransferase family 39 protein [Pseudomonadota bacterium]